MKRKALILILIIAVACPLFAAVHSSNVQILAGAKYGYTDNKFTFNGASLDVSEIYYTYKDENKKSGVFARLDCGAELYGLEKDSSKVGLNVGAFGGYSLGIGPLIKIEIAGGAEVFESSAITYFIKKAAKESYKISYYTAAAVDASVFIGLDNVSIRAGVRGSKAFSKTLYNNIVVTPYIGISTAVLNFLNIL